MHQERKQSHIQYIIEHFHVQFPSCSASAQATSTTLGLEILSTLSRRIAFFSLHQTSAGNPSISPRLEVILYCALKMSGHVPYCVISFVLYNIGRAAFFKKIFTHFSFLFWVSLCIYVYI